MPRLKQLPAAERLKAKLDALGYTWFKPEYIRRLTGKHRNAEWWQVVPREAHSDDILNQRFCSWYTVAHLAKDGVEIEVRRDVGYLWIHIKKAKESK